MRFGIHTLDEFDVAGKTVLCRLDLNQPVDCATDTVLTGGLVGNILLTARGEAIGQESLDFIYSSNYGEYFEKARDIYKKYADKILLPSDLAYVENGGRRECMIGAVPPDICAVDIGSRTAKQYVDVILAAKTVFVNGPMGIFEKPET